MSIEFVGLIVGVGVVFLFALQWLSKRQSADDQQPAPAPSRAVPAPDPAFQTQAKADRLAAIDACHANELNSLEVRLADCEIPDGAWKEAAAFVQRKEEEGKLQIRTGNRHVDTGAAIGKALAGGVSRGFARKHLESVRLRRTLHDIPEGDRATLRLADILHVLGRLSAAQLARVRACILWSGGRCLVGYDYEFSHKERAAHDAGLQVLMKSQFAGTFVANEIVQAALRGALGASSTLPETDRRILEQYLFAGSRWMAPAEMPASNSPSALKLGTFEGTTHDFDFDRRESLITIAPPGAGKSQAHVIRNLLNLRTPAVVLDIKGEAFRSTARWRKENVGPVFAFAPNMLKVSTRYNPLDGISTGPDAWDEARRLADLVVIPNNSDSYFENRARDLLTIALLDVAQDEPPERRHMGTVVDRLYLSDEEFEDWLTHLSESEIPMLRRQANAWRGMPRKQRESVFDSARNHMEPWQSPALAAITSEAEFTPSHLRGQNGTLYICVNLEDVKKYASVIRVIIGQAIADLCRGEAEAERPMVTFFLDEMPRLGRMDVIEEGLDTARGHGVRFWLFCQNFGQLRSAYPNAERILANCAVRCYMDPDDDTAEELSRHLGQRRGLIDGTQKALAEATELKGPEFADKVIVFTRGKPPAKLVRRMAFADKQAQQKIAAQAPVLPRRPAPELTDEEIASTFGHDPVLPEPVDSR